MDRDQIRHEAAKLDALSDDDLFALIGGPHFTLETHSRKALIVKGKELFNRVWVQARNAVCKAYRENAGRVRGGLDLLSIISGPLAPAAAAHGVPLIPVALLLIRFGLESTCRHDDPPR